LGAFSGALVAVAVNYDSFSKELAFKKVSNSISAGSQEDGIEIQALSITLFYLNERLEVIHRKDYTK